MKSLLGRVTQILSAMAGFGIVAARGDVLVDSRGTFPDLEEALAVELQKAGAFLGDRKVRVSLSGWKHVVPRVQVTASCDGKYLAMVDAAVFDFEPEGLLAHRIAHYLKPGLQKAGEAKLQPVAISRDLQKSEEFYTALCHRLNAEPWLCGRDLATLRVPFWRRDRRVGEGFVADGILDWEISGSFGVNDGGKVAYSIRVRRIKDGREFSVEGEDVIPGDGVEIRVAEEVAFKMCRLEGTDTAWDRKAEIDRLRKEAKWALAHGLAIEAALGAERLWALGVRDVEVAEWRLRAHSLTAYPIWQHIHQVRFGVVQRYWNEGDFTLGNDSFRRR